MLAGKKILIAISGSIAAYKIVPLVRLLVKSGAAVKIVMTPTAAQFVSPLVLSTLSKHKVFMQLFEEDTWSNHVMLGRWADLMLVAPLSCNTLAKMAQGVCDNLLLAVYLSATCKVMCAPAMDEDMWLHPATQRNIATLSTYGNIMLNVVSGELASGLVGEGRMAEPEDILIEIEGFFRTNELEGHKVLITSGPTHEAIDPVRFIANHSTGKMGVALAEAFYMRGAEVVFVSGPTRYLPKFKAITVVSVTAAEEMYKACKTQFANCTIAVLAAAVADYTPQEISDKKIKKKESELLLPLKKTADILKALGSAKTHQLLVGFALETNDALANAQQKLLDKKADFIVLNSMENAGAGFGYDTNKVQVLSAVGAIVESPLLPKNEIAQFIIDTILLKNKYDDA